MTLVSRLRYVWMSIVFSAALFMVGPDQLSAKETKAPEDGLAAYIARAKQTEVGVPASTGSLWSTGSFMTNLATDYKAHNVNDLITIRIVEQTTAQAQGSVKADRSFDASSGISAFFGQLGPTSGLQSIFSPHSNQSLNGQAQTTSTSGLQTSLGGQVAEVLPNGILVVQAEREIEMNNERQRVVLRGLVRPGDILADNSVFSTSISSLEIELRGKGVISNSVRPPNILVRTILWLVGF